MRVKNQKSQLKTKKTVEKTLQSICVYKGKRNGFTLIEVIISLAIFSILSIAIFNFINVSVKTNQKSEITQQATLLGQSLLEELGSLNQLKIGNNELFGLSNVTIEEENCSNNQYCINDLNINDFNVDVSMNLLKNNSAQQVQSFSNEKQEIGLSIEISNKDISGQIGDNDKTKFTKKKQDDLIITISKEGLVDLKNRSATDSVKLDGVLNNGKTMINIITNNKNHATTGITIKNESDVILEGCLYNKGAGNGHLKLSGITIEPEHKGNFQIDTCDYNVSGDSSDNQINNVFQETTTLDLYEVKINVYSGNSRDLIFTGERVLPLEFIREEKEK